jgi:uncharacterized protein
MFRPLRRKSREIDTEAAESLLMHERRGILAVNGDDGYPYAVPIDYIYDREAHKIIFHGARAGYKFEALSACDKVCFTVYGNETIKKEAWAPYVQSVVIFGRCHMVEDEAVAIELLRKLARKYYPDEQTIEDGIARNGKAAAVFEIEIEHLCGKEIHEK